MRYQIRVRSISGLVWINSTVFYFVAIVCFLVVDFFTSLVKIMRSNLTKISLGMNSQISFGAIFLLLCLSNTSSAGDRSNSTEIGMSIILLTVHKDHAAKFRSRCLLRHAITSNYCYVVNLCARLNPQSDIYTGRNITFELVMNTPNNEHLRDLDLVSLM